MYETRGGGLRLTPVLRGAVAALALIHAAVFFSAAWLLPWSQPSFFSAMTVIVAFLWLAVFVAAAVFPRFLAGAWTIAGSVTLSVSVWLTWMLVSGALHLAGIYGALGQGLAVVLGVIWAALALFTLPLSLWGLVVCLPGSSLKTRRSLKQAGLIIFGVLAAGILFQGLSASGRRLVLSPADEGAFHVELKRSLQRHSLLRAGEIESTATAEWTSLYHEEPVHCRQALQRGTWTLVLTYQGQGGPHSKCIQASTSSELLADLSHMPTSVATGPLKLDLVRSFQGLSSDRSLTAAFELRPGLDGVCLLGHCLMPWQLLSSGAFSSYRPLSFIPDLQFGASLDSLARKLGGSDEQLVRIATTSWVWTADRQLLELSRMHKKGVAVTSATLQEAESAAENHILAAQEPRGRFRYSLHPFTQEQDRRTMNLPRQAGVTLALCELGEKTERTRIGIVRSLNALSRKERVHGNKSFLMRSKIANRASLGDTSLPLAAFVVCRQRVGNRYDPLIGRLARGLLALQLESGNFASHYEFERQRTLRERQPLYGLGQAILGLGALEGAAASAPELFPSARTLRRAVERAMTYVTQEHWSHSLRQFFFIEENWHCIAARRLLSTHRNQDYEKFCLDYVRFKSRLILERDVAPEFVGGFGFGNLVPPHNTGTAGFAETLSASLFLKQVRGEALRDDQARLQKVLGFLLRQQWSRETCFACGTPDAIGSMSEHTHSATSRIDFVQHLWAGLGHGREALLLERARSVPGSGS